MNLELSQCSANLSSPQSAEERFRAGFLVHIVFVTEYRFTIDGDPELVDVVMRMPIAGDVKVYSVFQFRTDTIFHSRFELGPLHTTLLPYYLRLSAKNLRLML